MGKREWLKLAASSLGAIFTEFVHYLDRGGPIDSHTLVAVLYTAVLFRLGAFLVSYFGPKPV